MYSLFCKAAAINLLQDIHKNSNIINILIKKKIQQSKTHIGTLDTLTQTTHMAWRIVTPVQVILKSFVISQLLRKDLCNNDSER